MTRPFYADENWKEEWREFESTETVVNTFENGSREERQTLAHYIHWLFERQGEYAKEMHIAAWDWSFFSPGIDIEVLDAFADEFGFVKIWWTYNLSDDISKWHKGIAIPETTWPRRE